MEQIAVFILFLGILKLFDIQLKNQKTFEKISEQLKKISEQLEK
ncbi:hypothetical protein V7056_17070 [Bacillus sp. JJ664]